ncbi:hypothetical protein N6H14_26595 [Paenibacillus sp. CC-CFT747]|nr:hypothetical protein N6H14_26595 [Paenibacillus sp. CC-CFT747]
MPDRDSMNADGVDVLVLRASVVDAQGCIVPTADHEIEFHVAGAGKLIGVGNGNPSSHESDKGTIRRAFNGRCLAIVQSTGEEGVVAVTASATGLLKGSCKWSAVTIIRR